VSVLAWPPSAEVSEEAAEPVKQPFLEKPGWPARPEWQAELVWTAWPGSEVLARQQPGPAETERPAPHDSVEPEDGNL
jgi:hypothetical protein